MSKKPMTGKRIIMRAIIMLPAVIFLLYGGNLVLQMTNRTGTTLFVVSYLFMVLVIACVYAMLKEHRKNQQKQKWGYMAEEGAILRSEKRSEKE